MHNLALIPTVIFCFFLSSCGTDWVKNNQVIASETGVLLVLNPQDCLTPGECGPQHSIISQDFDQRTELLGDNLSRFFNEQDSGLVFEVTGEKALSSEQSGNAPGYEDIQSSILVSSAKQKTKLHYHELLVAKAASFTKMEYGCELKWNKSFSWHQYGNSVSLNVTMTNTNTSAPFPSVQLSYDGNSGERLSVITQPDSLQPCSST